MRRLVSSMLGLAMVGAGVVAFASPASAVVSNCTTWKLLEQGGARCTGSGGSFRIQLDCPWSSDYYSDWYVLSSTPRSVSGTCDPWTVRNVYVHTR
nr:hypothetical protein [Micromonospora sp. DSM 115978]